MKFKEFKKDVHAVFYDHVDNSKSWFVHTQGVRATPFPGVVDSIQMGTEFNHHPKKKKKFNVKIWSLRKTFQ